MYSMNFVIPLNKDELLDSNSSERYCVKDVVPVSSLPGCLAECQDALELDGADFILQNFDLMFSVLVHFKDLQDSLISKEWDFLTAAYSKLISSLGIILEDVATNTDEAQKDGEDKNTGSNLDTETRLRNLNTLRMLTYIYSQMFINFEDQLAKKNLMAPPETKKGRKKGRNALGSIDEEEDVNYDDKRQGVLSQFYSLLQLPINRLWDPPVAEEEFINLIANCCYKILEDPEIQNARLRHIRESIFQVLGILIKRHNHGLSCSLKIVQLLKLYERTSVPLAQGLISFAGPALGCRSMVREVLREISEADPGEFSADASGTRAICQFLTELSLGLPALMQASISLILPQLEFESYTMRICVLGVLTEIISKLLNGEDLEESAKNSRDLFLDHLEAHMHDINAFVRSKVMQYWQRLCQEKAVPLNRQHEVLEKAVGRLSDKSVMVRKFALQLVKAFLEGNPFTAKIGLKDLLSQLEVEKKTLADLEKKYGLVDKDKDGESGAASKAPPTVDPARKAEWKKLEPGILEAIYLHLDDSSDPVEEEIIEDILKLPLKRLYETLIKELMDEKFNVVAQLLVAAKRKHADAHKIKLAEDGDDDVDDGMNEGKGETEKVFSDEDDTPTKERKKVKNLKKRMKYFGKLLRKIFLENVDLEDEAATEEIENAKEAEEGDPKESDNADQLDADAMQKIQMQSALVNFLEDSVVFARLVSGLTIPRVCKMLNSNHSSDVLEAIEFFTSASKFGLSEAKQGIREMLPLVFAKEVAVKDAVVAAYGKLYLLPDDMQNNENADGNEMEAEEQEQDQPEGRRNPRGRAFQVVRNLTGLIIGANMGERDSLEELMRAWVAEGLFDSQCIKVLWERFSGAIPGTTPAESRAAVVLLGMVAGAEVQTIWSNLHVMVKVGLKGEKAQNDDAANCKEESKFDSLMIAETCEALLRMAMTHKKKQDSMDPPLRLPTDHIIFTTLTKILLKNLWNFQDKYYIPMAGVAIDVLYNMSEKPDITCGKLIKDICLDIQEKYFQESAGGIDQDITMKDSQPQGTDAEEQPKELMGPPAPPQPSKHRQIPVNVLSRLMFVVGHVAFRQFIFLDTQVFTELKRRNNVREKIQEKLQEGKKGNQKTKKKASTDTNTSKTHSVSASEKSRLESTKSEDGVDDIVGAVADDAEAEFIRNVCEVELVTENNLLSLLCPMVVMICSKPKKYHDNNLRTSVVLALAKYMCVSSVICQKYMQLLVTVMERSPEPVIRANCIIALGDLCYRFPNITEPWSPNLYGRLRDESDKVRHNTLMVLTHLIMNDMVKVKGQISDMALCILDPNQKLSEIAKLFFKELSQKGNALYNVMTDIISRLSNPALGVPEETFQTILSFLIQLIQKDRQIDSLVEKLCLRFQTTSSGAFMNKNAEEQKELPAAEPKVNGIDEGDGDAPKEKEVKTADEVIKDSREEDEKRQWRDLAFCLSLLPYNSERAIRRLISHLSCYADKIAKDEQVYTYFMNIVANARKAAKAEMKVVVDELEQKIKECIATADEDGNVPLPKKPVQTPVKKGPNTIPKSVLRSARRRRKPVASSSGSDFESDDDRGKKAQSTQKSVQRRKGRPQKKSVDSDEEELPTATRTSRNPRRKVVYDDCGSGKENEKQDSSEKSSTPSPEPKRVKRGNGNPPKSAKKPTRRGVK